MKSLATKGNALNERSRRNLLILETIRRSGPLSKADISRIAGVNVVTISNYIESYIRNNLVHVKSIDVSAGGRRPALLAINPQGNLAMGIGLNLHDMIGVVIDLNAQVVTHVVKNRPNAEAKDVVDSAMTLISELCDQLSGPDKEKVRGVGIGMAGIVDHQNGTIRWPRKLNNGQCQYTFVYAPLRDMVEKRFRIPCILENDATVACLAEQWLSPDPPLEDVIYMFSGVGCGLMFNGEVYRGITGGAGEISLGIGPAPPKILSEAGSEKSAVDFFWNDSVFFQPWEDDLGIVREIRQSLKDTKAPETLVLEFAKGKVENIHLRLVFQAARAGDTLALEKVRKAGRRLGAKVAFLVNLLNPQGVIIGGGMEEGGSVLLEAIKSTVSELAFSEMVNAVKIVPSRLGNNAVAIGAASLIVRQVFVQG